MVGRLILVRIEVDGGFIEKHVWVGQEDFEDKTWFKKLVADIKARYNIKPSQPITIIKPDMATGKLMMPRSNWGFNAQRFDPRSQSMKPAFVPNARTDKLLNWKVWREALSSNRCVIPATAFYEWQTRKDSAKNVPWEIRFKATETFYIAGICQAGKDKKSGDDILETALITQDANSLLRWIHNQGNHPFRQPVVLDKENLDAWLDPKLKNPQEAIGLLRQIEDGEFEARILDAIGDDNSGNPPKARAGTTFITDPKEDPEFKAAGKVNKPVPKVDTKGKMVSGTAKAKKSAPKKTTKKSTSASKTTR